MAKKGRKPTPQEQVAGEQNLQKWLTENPSHGNLKHGAYSQLTKRRYQDGRYREAKELRGIVQRLTDDAGGPENLLEGQRIMLRVIYSKFIVAKQISDYVAGQEGIVNGKGEILPCLKSFCTFTEAMRRSIEAFYAMANKKRSKILDLESYLQGKNRESEGRGI